MSNENALTLCIGVGNEFRHDDGVGRLTVRALVEHRLPGVCIAETCGEGAVLIEMFKAARRVFIIDAVSSSKPPGTIFRLDACSQSIPGDFFAYSSHAFSVAEAVEMAKVLGRLPPEIVIYGIQGADFSSGKGLSPEVEAAIQKVIERIVAEINKPEQHLIAE
ncbi:MAG TPA: hydrogenase maturation protease [Aggregatilineales bacterium]|nr:hydrogenase maturation protease [Aggregatilineales bacterium]